MLIILYILQLLLYCSIYLFTKTTPVSRQLEKTKKIIIQTIVNYYFSHQSLFQSYTATEN